MDKHMMIEMIGYLGSTLVVISMLMSSVMKLRIINSIGSCVFAAYALIIHSYPTALMNFCLVGINVYNMAKLLKHDDKHYHLVEASANDIYLDYFINHYMDDIKSYFSKFKFEKEKTDVVYYVCCEENPAGILLGHKTEDNGIEVSLEYTTPMYRDCSVGKYLYEKLSERGIKDLTYLECPEVHVPYLKKMGFQKKGHSYIKSLH